MEEGGVQLAPQQKPALLVPTERRATPAAVLRERLQVPRRVGQFQHSRHQPRLQRLALARPCALLRVDADLQHGQLFDYVTTERSPADLLASSIIERERGEIRNE